ncbi:hypothetical protein FSP39_001361 [Pinctada imbricata]|uniref:Uncharacterized protein n=1 Tax=Pinctada imbricata TaxID=66713 RepID=A0AA88Y5Z7_PINIB|nr:hypothetical protein FSP39_001361 [Pinctada imbricata]
MVGFSSKVNFTDKTLRQNDVLTETEKDVPFIAPYRFNASAGKGHVFYRIVTSSAEMDYLGKYMEESVIQINYFRPTWVAIVTWREIEYESKFNTFQLVLLTDHINGFAVFNYDVMNIPAKKTFQAGFYGGYGQGWTDAIPYDQLPHAHQETGSDVRGRFIFKIDESFMIKGGCRNFRHNSGNLMISPSVAGMLGGEMLNVSGPCFRPNDRIFCKFGADEALAVTSIGFVRSTTRSSCYVPKLLQRGRVKISLSIDHGESYYYSTYIYILHPLAITPHVRTAPQEVDILVSETITVQWSLQELTDNPEALIDVQIIGYFENSNWGAWTTITKVGSNIAASAERFQFTVSDFPCIASDCTRFDVGFIEIKLQDGNQAGKRRSLNSEIVPLTWFRNTAMSNLYGSNWPTFECKKWYDKDRMSKRWYREIDDCPCTLRQALADVTRWTPSRDCDLHGNRKCSAHSGAIHCVESLQKTFFDAANSCCYAPDGLLMQTVDFGSQGSVPMRSDVAGTPPYINSGIVPYMSYLLSDVMPYRYCCEWGDTCHLFTELRPTTNCVSYKPNHIAWVYGQGHFSTFTDPGSATVCNSGDYVLVEAPGVVIQGRLQNNLFNTTKDHKVNDTVTLTNIGIQYDSENIEVRLKSPAEVKRSRLVDVIVNKEYVIFNKDSPRRRDFTRSIIVDKNNYTHENREFYNITVILKDGIGVEIEGSYNRLSVAVHIPDRFKGMVDGLLGKIPETEIGNVQNMSSLRNITYKWTIQSRKTTSIFNTLIDPDKIPEVWKSPCLQTLHRDLGHLVTQCEQDERCLYDLASTRNTTLARSSLLFRRKFAYKKKSASKVQSCSAFDVKNSVKNSRNYTVGSSVTITGCKDGYNLNYGSHKYVCLATSASQQIWTPRIQSQCFCKSN